jgi:ComF family protein
MILLKRITADLISLLFPELCNACGRALVAAERNICTACLYDLPYTDFHLFTDNKVAKQLWGRLPANAVMAMLFFRKGSRVQTLIHRLKYNGKMELGFHLGQMLGTRIMQSSLYKEIDFIIPVPLHKKRERIRGYNQSKCIADGLGAALNVRVLSGILTKPRSTDSQTRKGRFSRFENLRSVFHVTDPMLIQNRHVLLIDDVITTGATLESCGLVLYAAGIGKLSIAAIAFAD